MADHISNQSFGVKITRSVLSGIVMAYKRTPSSLLHTRTTLSEAHVLTICSPSDLNLTLVNGEGCRRISGEDRFGRIIAAVLKKGMLGRVPMRDI